MNKLARVNQLLDDYLYGKIKPANMQMTYQDHIEPAYNRLTFRGQPVTFYDGEQLVGKVSYDGDVGFKRKYPELGIESYLSPEEILQSGKLNYREPLTSQQTEILQNYKKPTRELIKLNRAFQDYSNSPDGARLYYNTPLSDHRGDAYTKMGFQSPADNRTQYLDNRPYGDTELFNKLYLAGDLNTFGLPVAELAAQQRMQKNRLASGSRIAKLFDSAPEAMAMIEDAERFAMGF